MCGLTGFARHPQADGLELSLAIFTELLACNESRGHHATGVAAVGGSKPFLLKKAVEASKFIKSEPFAQRVGKLAANTPVLMGHTRHATHRNAHEDEAAHPFHMGKVIGAHNGVIHNWRDIEAKVFAKNDGHTPWINDSQAAFAVLDKWKDPVKATDQLDGWWALTWTRDRYFWMCRSGVEVAAAYVGAIRTLFWSSDINVLTKTLDSAGLDKTYDAWVIKPNTIYRYDPMAFDEKSANAAKKDAPFKGIDSWKRSVKLGSSGRGDDIVGGAKGGYSTTRSYAGGTAWDGVNAREIDVPVTRKKATAAERNASLGAIGAENMRLWDFVAKLNGRLNRLESENEQLRAEVEHMYAVMNAYWPEAFDGDETQSMADDESSPYAETPQADGASDPRQIDLVEEIERGKIEPQTALEYVHAVQDQMAANRRAVEDAPRVCAECEQGGGQMLRLPDGGYIHEACVLVN